MASIPLHIPGFEVTSADEHLSEIYHLGDSRPAVRYILNLMFGLLFAGRFEDADTMFAAADLSRLPLPGILALLTAAKGSKRDVTVAFRERVVTHLKTHLGDTPYCQQLLHGLV